MDSRRAIPYGRLNTGLMVGLWSAYGRLMVGLVKEGYSRYGPRLMVPLMVVGLVKEVSRLDHKADHKDQQPKSGNREIGNCTPEVINFNK